ncbi:MAG: potassium transporter Kup [Burkholderiaceae bacterium]|jgi:KUP system potassium uptake protein
MSIRKNSTHGLILGAVGVVYGDIGTSPLYALKEVFSASHGVPLNEANLLGVISLIVWGLALVVSLKYITLILRADNNGEGGIMALMALALSSVTAQSRWHIPLTFIGLVGAAMFFGDGIITPAISVLSAIEGIEVATPAFQPYLVPLTVLVLFGLYFVQRKGSAGIGRSFGPVMLVWFLALAAMGIYNIIQEPGILWALSPLPAFYFATSNPWITFIALGAIVLAFTGAEALYADMGHFGKRPMRLAWSLIVFPSLALNYLGQGALLLSDPEAVVNPFFHQLGEWSIYPLVALATLATIIASQATISGTFSMVQQAISLGFLPRMRVIYTSDKEIGQIYIPFVNWVQLSVVIMAVVGFGSSSNLAAAYGIAVTTTMATTTMLTFFVIRYRWRYSAWLCWFATAFFFSIDLTLFSASALKIAHGGWFPLVLGLIMLIIMLTWKSGRLMVFENLQKQAIPVNEFLDSLFLNPPTRVPGTAVFMRGEGDGIPHAMLHNLAHNKVLHAQILFLTVHSTDVPTVPLDQRVMLYALGHQCYQINVNYGFKDERDIPLALEHCQIRGIEFDMMQTSFFISRQTVIPTVGSGMALWREHLFTFMSRNARNAADYFRIPSNRVIELGTQVEI